MADGDVRVPQTAVLRNPEFLKLWAGQVISALGDSVAYMGLSFLILYRLGGSAIDVGKMMIAATIPTLVLGPVAGVFVDRWSRRRVMIVADVIRGLIYLAVPFATSLAWVYIGIFCASIMSRFFYPAKSAIVPSLVASTDLMAASGLNQTSGAVVSIVGPALGGALAGTFGPGAALAANAVSFFISGILIAAIRINEPAGRVATAALAPVAAAAPDRSLAAVLRQLADGLRFLGSQRAVRFYTGFFAACMLCLGGINVLFVPFAKDVLGFSIQMIGLSESSQAVGGLIGAIVVTLIAARMKRARLIFGSVVAIGLLLAALGLNRAPLAALLLMAGIGAALSALNIPLSAELMKLIPDAVRGRVWAAFGAATDGCSLISMAVLPVVATRTGLVPVITAVGIAVGLLGALATMADHRLSCRGVRSMG